MDDSRRASLVGPAILIVLGIVFLLNSLEIIPWRVWGTLWRFWPLILILIGVEIILSRTGASRLISLVVALAIVVIGVGVVVGVAEDSRIRGILPGEEAEEADRVGPGSFFEELGGLRDARVSIEFGAGRLTVNSASGPERLVVVDYSVGSPGRVPRVELSRTGRVGALRISGVEGFRLGPRAEPDRWDIHLNPTIPLDLIVKVGAADGSLDLRDLKIRTLNLDVGASSLTVNFPAGAGQTRAVLSSGAASLNLEIPAGVGARIMSESGLASINVASRFAKSGSIYTTDDYLTAENRLDLELRAGVSSVSVK